MRRLDCWSRGRGKSVNRYIAFVCILIIWGTALPVWSDISLSSDTENSPSEHVRISESDGEQNEESPKKIEAGIRMLLVFPTAPDSVPFTESELTLFRSSLGETDEMGIVIADRKKQVLALNGEAQVKVSSARVMDGLRAKVASADSAAEPERLASISIDETIRNAVSQLSDFKGMLKAVVLILDSPVVLTSDSDVASPEDTAKNADAAVTLSSLNALLALNNVILYSVYAESVHNGAIEQLTEQSGGKNIYLSSRVPLIDALYTAYDSILLRTIQLAPETALYESDTICEPPTAASENPDASELEPVDNNHLEIILLLALMGLCCVIVGLLIFIVRQTLGSQGKPDWKIESQPENPEKAPPSFSRLTIGINRVRNSFSEMESKLNTLSGDLDDFGSDNWELQKKIISAYAEISRELFLLYDHLSINDATSNSEDPTRLKRKIEQAMENNSIGEIVPEVGERFHSKYHCLAGERASAQKSGTIVEVIRKGYQREGFIGDKPFVLRQAEVIVSSGNEQGK